MRYSSWTVPKMKLWLWEARSPQTKLRQTLSRYTHLTMMLGGMVSYDLHIFCDVKKNTIGIIGSWAQ